MAQCLSMLVSSLSCMEPQWFWVLVYVTMIVVYLVNSVVFVSMRLVSGNLEVSGCVRVLQAALGNVGTA